MKLEIDTSFLVGICEELEIKVEYRDDIGDRKKSFPIKIKVPMMGKPTIFCNVIKKTERFINE